MADQRGSAQEVLSGMRAELTTIRRAVEGLLEARQDATPTEALAKSIDALAKVERDVVRRLDTIEAAPALKATPSQFADDHRRAIDHTAYHAEQLSDGLAHQTRTKLDKVVAHVERRLLDSVAAGRKSIGVALAAAFATLLSIYGLYALARWVAPERVQLAVAASVLDAGGLKTPWTVGQEMMARSGPSVFWMWRYGSYVVNENEDRLTACMVAANEDKAPVTCVFEITVNPEP